MAKREAYLRCSRRIPRGSKYLEVVAGLEWREEDEFTILRHKLRLMIMVASSYLLPEDDELDIVGLVEYRLKLWWPDRAYFIEVSGGATSEDGVTEEDWIQVFQPYGIPRDDGHGNVEFVGLPRARVVDGNPQ